MESSCECYTFATITFPVHLPPRPASFSTSAQPKELGVAKDGTAFVVETGVVEAVRSNQRVAEFKPKFPPSVVASSGDIVALGYEVGVEHATFFDLLLTCR